MFKCFTVMVERSRQKEEEEERVTNELLSLINSGSSENRAAAKLKVAIKEMLIAQQELSKELSLERPNECLTSLTPIQDMKESSSGGVASAGFSYMQKVKQYHHDLCYKINQYSPIFDLLPSGGSYATVLYMAINTIVKATVHHREIEEGFKEALSRISIELDFCVTCIEKSRDCKEANSDKMRTIVIDCFTLYFRFLAPYAQWSRSHLKRFKASFDTTYYERKVEEPLRQLLHRSRDLEREVATATKGKVDRIDKRLDIVIEYCKNEEVRHERQIRGMERLEAMMIGLSEKIGKKGNEQNMLAAMKLLSDANEHESEGAVDPGEILLWRYLHRNKIQPRPSTIKRTSNALCLWRDIETASHFLETIGEKGYPIDAKSCEDIMIAPSIFKPVEKWLSEDGSRWLWMRGAASQEGLSQVSVTAYYVTIISNQSRIPLISYRLRADDYSIAENAEISGSQRPLAMDRFVLMIYSILRQLVWLLPDEIPVEVGVSEERFYQLDGSTESLLGGFNLLEILLSMVPDIVIFVLDGFQYIDNDNEIGCCRTYGYLDLFLSILRKAGKKRSLKVLITSDGLCRALMDNENVGIDEQYHWIDPTTENKEVSDLWEFLDRETSTSH